MNFGIATAGRRAFIVGAKGLVSPKVLASHIGITHRPTTTHLIEKVLKSAALESGLELAELDALIAVPSLADSHFMEAHYQATQLGLFSSRNHLRKACHAQLNTLNTSYDNTLRKERRRCLRSPLLRKTVDTGGAGPVTALLEATRMIQQDNGIETVAVVAADVVGSMAVQTFLKRADSVWLNLDNQQSATTGIHEDFGEIRSPVIPFGYDRVTDYQMKRHKNLHRDHLRMVVSLESFHASMHEGSLFHQQAKKSGNKELNFTSLEELRNAESITPHISILECARRADGAGCIILGSDTFLKEREIQSKHEYNNIPVSVIGGGEGSGFLYPPMSIEEEMFSCESAISQAYEASGNIDHTDIDFFGLYDCFPICLLRAVEACGLCPKGQGGTYLEAQYKRVTAAQNASDKRDEIRNLCSDKQFFPINTHGGLLCFGAPWEVPAIYNVIEAFDQLQGRAKGRQIEDCKRALCYGNGGIFSSSAVAILEKLEA